MGYESELIIGEVFGNHNGMPGDPAPMWMNPIITMRLSKMGHDSNFAKLREAAKYAGVFRYQVARLDQEQELAIEMAVDVIKGHAAPKGSFKTDVPWWKTLLNLQHDRMVEHREHEDSYGEPFKRLGIEEARDACRADFLEGERPDDSQRGYRRALMATMVLEHFLTAIHEGRWTEYDPNKHGTTPCGEVMLIHEGY